MGNPVPQPQPQRRDQALSIDADERRYVTIRMPPQLERYWKALRERIARIVWDDAPQPELTTRGVTATALTLKATQVLHYACAGNLGAPADADLCDHTRKAMFRILFDFRSGKPQTTEERAIGELLDHVARTYLEAKHE